jgi:hypothetical protein
MRIISFDVGMKNLAFCIFSISNTTAFTGLPASELIHHIHIERWDVIDLRFEPNLSDSIVTEVAPPPPKRLCSNDNKLAKWMFISRPQDVSQTHSPQNNTVVMYCAKCAEKSKYKIPSREILPIQRKPELLTKKKLGELMDIKTCLGTTTTTTQSLDANNNNNINLKVRKSDLIEEIKTTISRDFMEPFDEQKYSNYITGILPTSGAAATKPKKANYTYAHDLDLITYGRNMMKHLDVILAECSEPIDMMIIENQISTLASRMKTLQGMITQYFIMKHIPMIEFISASCKLKLFMNTPLAHHDSAESGTANASAAAENAELCIDASTYADRKKSGIAVCRSLGEISRKHKSEYAKWMCVFEKHKKKDDLADCFLQGLWRVHSESAV